MTSSPVISGLPPSEWSGRYVRIELGRRAIWDASGTAPRRYTGALREAEVLIARGLTTRAVRRRRPV